MQERSLEAVRPELFAELHPTRNADVDLAALSTGSVCRVWWRCGDAHEWQATVAERSRGTGCPVCWAERRAEVPLARSLAAIRPELVAELHPSRNGELDATRLGAASSRKVWWRCRDGHEWAARVFSRSRGSGCPVCRSRRHASRKVSLAVKHPELVGELHPSRNGSLDPFELAAHSNFKVWWRCGCGHEWAASVASRVTGSGCPECAKRRPPLTERSLAVLHPELAAELHPTRNVDLDPRSLAAGSSWKVWWRCPHGHEWEDVVWRRARGKGCLVCGNDPDTRTATRRPASENTGSKTERVARGS